MSKLSPAELHEIIGDQEKTVKEMSAFTESAQLFSSDHPRLIDSHPSRWVAAADGKLLADAETFEELLAELDAQDVPRQHALVRFIDKDQRTFIL